MKGDARTGRGRSPKRSAGAWRRDQRVARFAALFNRRDYFKAHEVLEALWLETSGPDRPFLQGLIQLAVALEHLRRGNRAGARKVLASARRRLEGFGSAHAGIPAASLIAAVASHIEGERAAPPRIAMGRAAGSAVAAARSAPTRGARMPKAAIARPSRAGKQPRLEPLAARRARAGAIARSLRALYPDARCELTHQSALELLVATILSAQCTDVRVNMTTPALFARYPDAASYASADPEELGEIVRSTGFYRNKAKSIIALGKALVGEHGGAVPDVMEALVTLPGVGRKTANVILSEWFTKPGIAVDTHVIRLTGPVWRLTDETDPVKIEFALYDLLPEEDRSSFGIGTIFHGRRICTARAPNCPACPLVPHCPTAFSWPGTARLLAGSRTV